MWALTVKNVKKNLYSSLVYKPQETGKKNNKISNGRNHQIPTTVAGEKIDGL
jgi:hypothetical protein